MKLHFISLFVVVCTVLGYGGATPTGDSNPFQIVLLGVPETITDEKNVEGKHMVVEATYQWGSDLIEKCDYKVKAEAIKVTNHKMLSLVLKRRFFVKIYVDHRLLDIVEYTNAVKFGDKVIKDGLFINKVIAYDCKKLEFEYLMKIGKCCYSKTYEMQRIFRENVDLKYENWRWKAFDQEMCENSKTRNFEVEAKQKQEKYPFVIES
ncbi:uncharacterized protein LOC129004826 [Macrosteles quadrilineatus]|uniref:uncharacterized protein LOC129004826 n=1 Tax=Macrosteles quadrilineatus TaxID=74068 RepID=UPI0023E1CD7F|nr:uncharacterized protein LOC129004826 [Macrosteles quadrilineatus]